VLSYGGQFHGRKWEVAIASPQVVAAQRNSLKFSKQEPLMLLPITHGTIPCSSSLQVGMLLLLMKRISFAPNYEDETQSAVAGKVGYALPPAGPDGLCRSGIWLWQLSMNKASQHKTAAWLFLNWVNIS